jgi:hypothetical protein
MDAVPGSAPDLRSELTLVRSAALYADRVLLYSAHGRIAADSVADLRNRITTETLLERLKNENPHLYEVAERSADPIALVESIVAKQEMPGVMHTLDELRSATGRGFLLHEPSFGELDDRTLESFLDRLLPVLAEPGTHAVCDVRAGEILRRLAEAGDQRVSQAVLRRSAEAEIGSGLIARIPAFPQAPLDELLDLKVDLAGPLERYRLAVTRLGAEIRHDFEGDSLDR